MHHHGGVHTIECAAVKHDDLAATALFARRAQHPHGDTKVVGDLLERVAGADRGCGDHVVAAGMTDSRQGVVLSTDCDGQFA